jgi:uncharacterized protein YggT (Ycf19 family)
MGLIPFFTQYIKIFKIFCYAKIFIEWLPVINPHIWPFCIFKIITRPYFYFWQKLFPTLKYKNFSINISHIIALEFLNSLIFYSVQLNIIIKYNFQNFIIKLQKIFLKNKNYFLINNI